MFTRSTEKTLHVLLLVAFACLFFVPSYTVAQSTKTKLAEINSYAAQVDAYVKRHARGKRIFGDVAAYDDSTASKALWREFKSQAAAEKEVLYSEAYVWSRDDRVVRADFTLSSPSGDWAHYVTYYFRDDGSLAKIESRLNTFYGDVSVVRNQYFNDRAIRISNSRKVLDLKTQKPTKSKEYMDQPAMVYRKVSDLPFYKLL